jgi:hypothetical protein
MMESEQVAVAKELLKRKRAMLLECLRGSRGAAPSAPHWLQGLSQQKMRQMVKAVNEALEQVGHQDFGYCQSCFMRMPWADIVRSPERKHCSVCLVRAASLKKVRPAKRRGAVARR